MKAALMLVDMQSDYLSQYGLMPPAERLIFRAAHLLGGARELGWPVFHVLTRIRQDGSDRMPHWKENDQWLCVEDTQGFRSPEPLEPVAGESLIFKQYYSGFSSGELDAQLRGRCVDTVILAGIHLHGCVRETAVSAYERGYRVVIADDAVGSYQPVHAAITRDYLNGRVATFLNVEQILGKPYNSLIRANSADGELSPVAFINGEWRTASANSAWHIRQNPSDPEDIVARVPIAATSDLDDACAIAAEKAGLWRKTSLRERRQLLSAWATILSDRSAELAGLMAREIGKPLSDGLNEMYRAVELVNVTADLLEREQWESIDTAAAVKVRYCPHGVVGLLTPWNNPVAIPAGKIAPALAFGNAIVWKPAIEAPGVAAALVETLQAAGMTPGVLNMVFGNADTGRSMIRQSAIGAISFTGGMEAGESVSALCAHYGKALQAELGGNNAALVLADSALEHSARAMALAAFSFSGQRCTAIQRFIVDSRIMDEFLAEFLDAVRNLRIGDPHDETTQIGPVISAAQREWLLAVIEQARQEGGVIHCGGEQVIDHSKGNWVYPVVISNLGSDSMLLREELFGPVALVLSVDGVEEAIAMANNVKQGLLTAVYGGSADVRQRLLHELESGILNFVEGPVPIHPAAPFQGWKQSGIGPSEHGIWDRDFYTRVQTVYGLDENASS